MYLSLESPADTGGSPILGYRVFYDNGEIYDISNIQMTTALQGIAEASVGQLLPNTDYEFYVVALNSISSCTDDADLIYGDRITYSTVTTSDPLEPRDVGLKSATGGGIQVEWVNPFDIGGDASVLYRLYMSETDETGLPTSDWQMIYNGTTTSYWKSQLQPISNYLFMVSAENSVGVSPNTTAIKMSTTNPSAPGPCDVPTFLSAGGGSLTFEWSPPEDNGGITVDSYMVQVDGVTNGVFKTAFTNVTTYRMPGLLAEHPYEVRIAAVNTQGIGTLGAIATFNTTEITMPDPPSTPQVTTATGGAVSIEFEPPADTGGVPPDELLYEIYANGRVVASVTQAELLAIQSQGGRRLAEDDTAVGFTVGSLDPSALYNFEIQSVSDAGTSDSSGGVEGATSLPTAPGSMDPPTIASSTGGAITLQWLVNDDSGGDPISAYLLYRSTAIDGTYAVVCEGLSFDCSNYGLDASTDYFYHIVAQNSIGDSPNSEIIMASTQTLSVPSAPGRPTATNVRSNKMTVDWSPSLDSGGLDIDNYVVTATKVSDLGTSATATTVGTSATIEGLELDTEYEVSVVSNNLQGASPSSVSRNIFTTLVDGSPEFPIVGCVSSTTISLSWNEFAGATAYILIRDDATTVYNGPGFFFEDTDLNANTQYSYTLKVIKSDDSLSDPSRPTLHTTPVSVDVNSKECVGESGYIEQTTYGADESKTWLISPPQSFSGILLRFSRFEVECDHDAVHIEMIGASGTETLWKGGCTRISDLVFRSTEADADVKITFTSDATVPAGGFDLYFEVDGVPPDTDFIPCPGPNICSKHGRCAGSAGVCTCNLGFTGEDCSNHIVCCDDPDVCTDDVCGLDPATVITVATDGNDVDGTGEMMTVSDVGTAHKAVASLSRAIELATAGDVVFVYPGLYSGSANCDLQVNKNIQIRGFRGSQYTIIDCSNTDRVLSLVDFTSSVEGLQFIDATATDGGAVHVLRGSPSFVDVQIKDSTADSGGGIFAKDATVSLTSSAITGTQGTVRGGGIYLQDSLLNMDLSYVSDCSSALGGGVYLTGSSSVTGVDASIRSNTATTGGGLASTGSSTIDGVLVYQNTADNGAGVSLSTGTHTITRTTVEDNTAVDGAGIHVSSATSATISLSVVKANTATQNGGGLFLETDLTVSLDTSSVESNNANRGGGLYLNDCAATVQDMTVSTCSAVEGAGVYVEQGSPIFERATIEDTTSTASGGGLTLNLATLSATTMALNRNAAVNGGGVHMIGSSLTGSGIVLLTNTATEKGGGIYGTGANTIEDASIESCTGADGGGVYFTASTTAVRRCTVKDCTASANGGGLYLDDTSIEFTTTVIEANEAVNGGGLHAAASTIDGGQYTLNKATNGGSLSLTGVVSVSNVIIDYSQAILGGGVYSKDAVVDFNDCTIRDNMATYPDMPTISHGGGLYLLSSTATHSNVAVTTCTAGNGGGLALVQSSFDALNSEILRISDSIALHSGGNVFCEDNGALHKAELVNGQASNGGGIALSNANFELSDIVIENSHVSQSGGGLRAENSLSVAVTDVIIRNNDAVDRGGGISLVASSLYHKNVSVVSNTANYGGGFHGSDAFKITSPDTAAVRASVFSANEVPEVKFGSNMFVDASASGTISNIDIFEGIANRGGAIYLEQAASVIVSHSTAERNHALEGGACYLEDGASLTLKFSIIFNNTASTGAAIKSQGETGIAGDFATVSVENSEIMKNTAASGSAGIEARFSHIFATDSLFDSNTVSIGGGGAIHLSEECNVAVTRCILRKNSALSRGGTISARKYSTVSFTDSELSGNGKAATEDPVEYADIRTAPIQSNIGALIYAIDKSNILLMNTTFSHAAAIQGGAIFIEKDSVIELDFSSGISNIAREFGGAALISDFSKMVLKNSTLSNNEAYYGGGGIYVQSSSTVEAIGSEISENRVDDRGAGIYLSTGSLVKCILTDSLVSTNIGKGFGSGIFGSRDVNITLVRTRVVGNGGQTPSGHTEGGGGIFGTACTVNLVSSEFEGNSAIFGGGLVVDRGGKLNVTKTIFRENTALENGGAISLMSGGSSGIVDSQLYNNTAINGGGIFLLDTSTGDCEAVTFSGNSAQEGGGVALKGSSSLKLTAFSTMHRNTAINGGGIHVSESATLTISTAEFSENMVQQMGAGLYINYPENVNVAGVSFTDNVAKSGGAAFWKYSNDANAFTCSGCSTSGNTMYDYATDSVNVVTTWWPTIDTSGTFIFHEKITYLNETEMVEITVGNETASNFTRQVTWPTLTALDFYGQRAVLDNSTRCAVSKSPNEQDLVNFEPADYVISVNGEVVYNLAFVETLPRTEPYLLQVMCTLESEVELVYEDGIQVIPCLDGYYIESDKKCYRCPKGTYRLVELSSFRFQMLNLFLVWMV